MSEVSVVQIRAAMRRELRGDGERLIAGGAGVGRKATRRYVAAAVALGIDRADGKEQLTDKADWSGGRAGASGSA